MSTVLIVEDAAIIREPIQAALRAAGYDVHAVADGTQALRILAERTPDLVLLDVNLPGVDGLSILRQMRENPVTKSVPVIMLTAVAEKQRVLAALKLGIGAYLLKSRFSLSEMLEQVRKQLAEPPKIAHSPVANDAREQAAQEPPLSMQSDSVAPAALAEPSCGTPIGARSPDESLPIDADSDAMEVLKSLKPIMSRSEITERLEHCAELKGLSPAVSQVLRLTGADRCSIEQVAKAISQDHAIALKVLKLANSAVYTRGEPVDSVQLAVSRIGLGQIRQTVLNLSVIDQFDAAAPSKHINFGQFWEHAIAVGIIAAELAHELKQDPDTAFTMGLLHDVGRMFLAEQFGQSYDQVLDMAAKLRLPAELVESRMLLYNHADVMDRVLHSWKFPKQLINPIVFHHLSAGNIRRSAPRQLTEVAMLGLANRLAHALLLGSSGNDVIYPTHDMCQMLKLEPQTLQAIHDKAREETDKVKFALLATSNTANWPQLRSVYREAIGSPFRPIYVSDMPEYDAIRIFCHELSDADASVPNVGVIHLSHPRERVPLTAAYRAAEDQAGVDPLPLLVCSPAGKLMPEKSLVANRRVATITTPIVVERFIHAAKDVIATHLHAAAA